MRNLGLVFSLNRHGGGFYQWTINLLNALEDYRKACGNLRINVFIPAQSNEFIYLRDRFPNFCYHQIARPTVFLSKILRRISMIMPFLISFLRWVHPINSIFKRNQIDLMIFPGTTIDASFCRGRQMFMFTDIAHVFYPYFPEVSANGQLRQRHIMFKYGIKYASQIVVDSYQLRQDIAKYYAADVSRVEVLYQTMSQTMNDNGDSDHECTDFRRNLPKRYIFYPAQLWAHKNHKNLFLAMKILVKEHVDLVLVLAGSKKDGAEHLFSLIQELEIQSNVSYLGYVPDKFMPLLYKSAQMLVMPTYFGPTNIPTLESFYYGCPAVISDLPGVTEQTKDAALLFNPDSPKDMAEKICLVLNDKKLREAMICKGHERMKVLSYRNYQEKLATILDRNLDDCGCRCGS